MKTIKKHKTVNTKTSILILLSVLISYTLTFAQWSVVTPNTNQNLRDIACPTPQVCYVVGDLGTVYKTIDGANTWQLKNSGIDVNEYYFSIYCFDTATCIIGQGNNAVYKTIDGGNSWYNVNLPVVSGASYIHFVNDSIGYIPYGGGNYFKSIDAGENWTWGSTGISNSLGAAIYFIDENV